MLKAAVLRRAVDRRLQRLRRAIDHPGERARDRHVSAVAQDVLRHRAVRHGLEPGAVQRRQQRAGIAVAEIGLVAATPPSAAPTTASAMRQEP